MTRIVLAAVGIVYFVATAFANEPSRDWPRWRGPQADGVADNRNLPTHWSQSDNVRWSVKLPGWGTSSPVVYGSRVFVTSELNQEGKKSLLTLCFDRTDGRELWRHDFGLGANQRVHEKSNLAVNTPAVTAEAVYVAFGNADIARYWHDGKLLWGNRYIVRAGTTFELLATNELGERITASPAISDRDVSNVVESLQAWGCHTELATT